MLIVGRGLHVLIPGAGSARRRFGQGAAAVVVGAAMLAGTAQPAAAFLFGWGDDGPRYSIDPRYPPREPGEYWQRRRTDDARSKANKAKRAKKARPKVRVKREPAATAAERERQEELILQSKGKQLLMSISLTEQRLVLYADGVEIARSPISSGTDSNPTPAGIFSIIQKSRFHRSNLYSNAPMPYMQRLTWDGVALHHGVLPGYPASHGCIRLPESFARAIFAATAINARVVVTYAPATLQEFANARLPTMKPKVADAPPTQPAAEPAASGAATSPGPRAEAPPVRPVRIASAAMGVTDAAPAEQAATQSEQGEGDSLLAVHMSITDAPAAALRGTVTPAASSSEAASPSETTASVPAAAPQPAIQSEAAPASSTPAQAEAPAAAPAQALAQTPAASAAASAAPAQTEAPAVTQPASTATAPAPAAPAQATAPTPPAAAPATPSVIVPAHIVEQQKAAKRRRGRRVAGTQFVEQPLRPGPISVFISRKENRLYVRKGRAPVFEAPVTFDRPKEVIGTHLFNAVAVGPDETTLRWVVMSIPSTPITAPGRPPAPPRQARGRGAAQPAQTGPYVPDAAQALERVSVPQEVIDRLSDLVTPGATLIISDNGFGNRTGKETDFIVLTR